ncbi:MAG: phosphoglycerate dehydrogenase [Planctomycetes bacterium]|nr:phosphoglycerate dehydrogenase [Planctomycetota bacterium]
MNILVSDHLSEEGLAILRAEKDMAVDVRKSVPPDELLRIIGNYDALIIRSTTRVTEAVTEAGKRLKVIGRAGVGVDNIDVAAATRRGIIVMNAPEGNTLSTAELTMALLLGLARNLYHVHHLLKSGVWDRSRHTGREIHGKCLGIIGLGRIGTEIVKRATAFGMKVLIYDPYASQELADRLEVQLCALDEVLSQADFITVHCPLTDSTRYLIQDKEFEKMKTGVRILNCARGGILHEGALQRAIESGKVAGCALDVFEQEPAEHHPLLRYDQVIATPHIGAATVEAQQSVAVQIAQQVVETLRGRPARNAVNLPPMDPEVLERLGPYIHLAEKLGRLLVQMAAGPLARVNVTYTGEMNDHDVRPITAALIKGLLEPVLNRPINYVNAPVIAQERGIKIIESKSTLAEDFSNRIALEAQIAQEVLAVVGTLFGKSEPRIVRINDYHLDAVPEGHMLIVRNSDRPGVIRHISTILADHQINIANMNVGRDKPGGQACTVVNVDTPLSEEALADIAALRLIRDVRQVFLG